MSTFRTTEDVPLSPYASKVAISMSQQKDVMTPRSSIYKSEKGLDQIDHLVDVESGTIDLTEVGSLELAEGQPKGVVRGLKSRHIQLIALGGAIGTGLFIGSGGALSVCGPAPLLISYLVMGFFIWCIMCMLTEIVCLMPIAGETSMYSMSMTYLNRPLSFMCGFNLFYATAMIPPSEITAAALVIKFWTNANSAIFVSIFVAVTLILTMLPVKFFGESEFWVSIIKLLCITGLIIVGCVIFFGGAPDQHGVLGFHYWKHPGAFNPYLASGNTGKFLACWTAIIKSGFSYVLVPEVVVSCAAESVNPRRNMPRVAERFVYRLFLFYVCGTLVIGVIIGYNSPRLMNALAAGDASAAASPFVIGIQQVGIKVLPHIVNACILTSAYSCGTSMLYGSSRSLYSMALKGDVPKIFGKTNRFGTPYVSVAAAGLFCFLAYLNCSNSSSVVFTWLSNIATVSGFVDWILVCVLYIRFRKVCDHGDLNDRVPFRKRFMIPLAYFTAGFFFILTLTNGYAVFIKGNWSTKNFFACYTTVGLIFCLFLGSTAYHRTWRLRNMDEIIAEIVPKIDQADEEQKNEVPIIPKNWLEKIWFTII